MTKQMRQAIAVVGGDGRQWWSHILQRHRHMFQATILILLLQFEVGYTSLNLIIGQRW